MLRIRILRVRPYPGHSYRRIPLGAGACARGKKRMESERRGTRRERLIGRSAENAHEKHA